MIPWLRGAWVALLNDPQRARRVTRGLLIGFGFASPGLVALLPATGWWRVAAYLVGGLAACVGGMVSASSTAPKVKPVKAPP